MKRLLGNALRNVKEFFTEPVTQFHFDTLQQDTLTAAPLFDQVALVPTALQSQPSNQAAVLNALARAAENYFLSNMAPLLRNVPELRWQIKQIQIRETAENMALLKEINQLSPAILNTVTKAILCKLPCADAMDISQYYGLSIVPENNLVGRAIVTWASIGQDKTAMQFYFDDEIIEYKSVPPEQGQKADSVAVPLTEFPFEVASDFHLKLLDDGGVREISIKKFPAVAGSGPLADIPVSGQYVSAQHLVLHWDAVLQCVYLTDRSKHGTFMKNGNRLAVGERRNLLGAGNFSLTNQVNAPRFEYWHGTEPNEGTALLPPDVCDALRSLAKSNAGHANHSAASASPPLAAYVKSLRARAPDPAPPGAATWLDSVARAQHTQLGASNQTRPLAWLQVRNAQKKVETVAITKLPFCIGREFEGDGFAVDEAYSKVSRVHLRVLEQRGSAFGVNNDSLQRPGQSNLTFGEKGAESHKFVWTTHSNNSNSGWRVLGANRIDAESLEVRLLAPDSMSMH